MIITILGDAGYMGAGMLISANVNPDMAVEATGVPDKDGVLRYDLYVARDGYQPSDYEPVPAPAPGPTPATK